MRTTLRICLLSYVALQAPTAAQTPSDVSERIVLVVRLGKLAEAEISPSPQLKVPALWRLALDGISVTRLEHRAESQAPESLEDLKRAFLPPEVGAEAVNWISSRPVQSQASPAQKALAERFGSPPELAAEERATVKAFRDALGAPALPEATTTPEVGVSSTDLRWLARSAVTLVRVPATTNSAAAAAERDDLLERVILATGPTSNVIVVNLPERGAGTLIARGPRLKRARVSEKPRSIAATRGLVASLLDPTAAEKDPSIREELVHELFK